MKEAIQRNNRIILMVFLSIGFFIGGYNIGFMVGKKEGHDQVMKLVDDVLKNSKEKENIQSI
jgi:hypothetical protein